ncbi:MAG: hypothetical protein ACLRS8_20210 [Parabacteroides merdae]
MAIFVLLDNTKHKTERRDCMNIMNMMWFMGMCLLSTVIIGGFFIHRDNKRNAAANKKGQSSKEG